MIYMAIANAVLAISLSAVVAMWLFFAKTPQKAKRKKSGSVVEDNDASVRQAKFAAKEIENFLSYNGNTQGEIEIE